MKRFTQVLLLAILPLSPPLFAQDFIPTQDAYLERGERRVDNFLRVEPTTRVAYLKFDLSTLPEDFEAATLQLTINGDPGSGTIEIFEGSNTAWTEANLSSNNAPLPLTRSPRATAFGNFLEGQTINFDLTLLLNLTTETEISLIVSMPPGSNDVSFGSTRSTTGPVLVVGDALDDPDDRADTIITYTALTDFPDITSGEVPYIRDTRFNALAIDASIEENRDRTAQASRIFEGTTGLYDVEITTLTEEDGESTYRLLVNGEEVATYTNPSVFEDRPRDLQPNFNTWESIALKDGDQLTVESNSQTNGLIPEDGGTAWARGRWRQLELTLTEARPFFDLSQDLLLAQFDSKPDADDVMAQAALACMLDHPDFLGVNYYGVAGAIGRQGGAFIDTDTLFELGFGPLNEFWTDADDDYPGSVTRIVERVRPVLEAGGTVWVQEAGQSDITADWIRVLLDEGISADTIKEHVIVVQHSQWNEDQTTPDDLAFTIAMTDYRSIDDGNADPADYSTRAFRGPETPNYVGSDPIWLNRAVSADNPNDEARLLWAEADRIIDDSGFNAGFSEIPGGGVDFSDCVEDWWIFNIGADAGDLSSFWDRYVVNQLDAYSLWRIEHFGTSNQEGITRNEQDPNLDGEANLLEFATGQDPNTNSILSIILDTEAPSPSFTYPMNLAAAGLGMNFTIESSNDLLPTSWTPTNASQEPGPITDGIQLMTVTLPADTQPKRFLRLRISF